MRLEGKTALVTGASRGIGRAIALALAKEGAFVAVNYNGSEEAARQVTEEIRSAGGSALAYQCSVADAAAVKDMSKSDRRGNAWISWSITPGSPGIT